HWRGTLAQEVAMRAVVKVGTILSLLTLMVRTPAAAQPRRVEPARSAAPGRSCANWRVVPAPTDREEGIAGIDGVSASDVWAVGVTGYSRGLIVHWDGRAWSAVPNPVHQSGEEFRGVLALSPTDAWAVGGRDIGETEKPAHRALGRLVVDRAPHPPAGT